jgi:hypothetical protein
MVAEGWPIPFRFWLEWVVPPLDKVLLEARSIFDAVPSNTIRSSLAADGLRNSRSLHSAVHRIRDDLLPVGMTELRVFEHSHLSQNRG